QALVRALRCARQFGIRIGRRRLWILHSISGGVRPGGRLHSSIGESTICCRPPGGSGRYVLDINALSDGFLIAMPWLSIARRIFAYGRLQSSAVRAVEAIDRLLNKRLA